MEKKEVLVELVEGSPVYISHPQLLVEYLIYNGVDVSTKSRKRKGKKIHRYLKPSLWFILFVVFLSLVVCTNITVIYLLLTRHWQSIFLLLISLPLVIISYLFFNKFMESLQDNR